MDIAGPDIHVGPSEANGIGILVHEMLTNALKYGALSSTEGRIAVEWSVLHDDPEALIVEIVGRERGAPRP